VDPAGKHFGPPAEPESLSLFDRAWQLGAAWNSNFFAIAAVAVGFTVFLGIPVGLLADDLSFADGLIVAAITGVALYGLVSVALTFLGLIAMVVDVVLWVWRRLPIRDTPS
jgi:hypothetical protein